MSYTSKYTGQEIDNKLDEVNNKANQSDLINLQNTKLNISDLLDKVYPVGSVYVSYASTSPASLFGGTWTQIKDRFLLAAGDTYTAASTGGSTTHTHTSAAHTHTVAGHTHTSAAHTHKLDNQGWAYISMDTSNRIKMIYSYNSGEWTANWQISGSSSSSSTAIAPDATVLGGKTASTTPGKTGSTSLTTNSTTPGATGSSSNLPPYLTLYMWRRTA